MVKEYYILKMDNITMKIKSILIIWIDVDCVMFKCIGLLN